VLRRERVPLSDGKMAMDGKVLTDEEMRKGLTGSAF
jgi:hypothetical protein